MTKATGRLMSYRGLFFTIFFLLVFTGPALAWTISANFENRTVGQKANGQSGFHEAGTATLYSTDVAHGGAQSAKITWTEGITGFGIAHGALNYPVPITGGGEVWARGYFYFPSGWDWTYSPVIKVLRIHVANSAGTNVGYISIMSNNSGKLVISNEVAFYQLTTGTSFDIGQWQNLEIYVKFSL